ncbi:MAG: DNA cytosine methyltransferase [Cryobacterium sp.]|nr:DNA cytosine methyltransferase [Cryobacterium sp.]
MRELTMIDLYAGAGGLTEGLREAGFRSLYANELVPTYAETFMANHEGSVVDARNIREVDACNIRKALGLKQGMLDLIAGGPPCQGFSINAPKRSAEDLRNHLFREFLRFVDEFQPRAVLIENVPGLVSFEQGATLESILRSLSELNYSAEVQILYAPHYGVPQTRWRTIILALRGNNQDALSAYPKPIHHAPMRINFTSRYAGRDIVAIPRSVLLPTYTSIHQAIGDLPVLQNGEIGPKVKPYRTAPTNEFQRALRTGSEGVFNHEAARLSDLNLKRFSHIPQGGNWTDIPIELLPKGMRSARRSDHTKRYGRIRPDGLASTILTKCDPHWGAFIHYEQDRAFTVREAARLQSFPDSYRFTGSRVEQYEQVGNAVPPLLAAAVGRSISYILGSSSTELRRVV